MLKKTIKNLLKHQFILLIFLEFKKDTLKNGKLKKKKPLKISIFYPFFIDILVNNNKIIFQ